MAQEACLAAKGVSMTFDGVPALQTVDFCVRPGEIRALIGANGAGKSTLMKILAGSNPGYTGTVTLGDTLLTLRRPADAQAHGIRLVSQEMDTALVPGLSVMENILMQDLNTKRGGRVDRKSARLDAEIALRALGCKLDVGQSVDRLSPAEKQMLLLSRVLTRESRFLLLDEPTAALSEGETERLFQSLRRLAGQQHVGIILVSHRLRELLAVCKSMTVLRDGRLVDTFALDGTVAESQVIAMMSGHAATPPSSRNSAVSGTPRLQAEDLSTRDGKLQSVSVTVKPGEIIGVGGLGGAGKTELCHVLYGALPPAQGSMYLDGTPYAPKHPAHAVQRGVALIPEERRRQGLWPDESLRFTLVSQMLPACSRCGVLSRRKETQLSEQLMRETGIKAASTRQSMRLLSGGNQQKAVIGKWLRTGATLLLFDEATKGVDAAAREDIFALIRALAAQGCSIVYTSADVEELLSLCDRIYMLYRGRVVCERQADQTNSGALLHYATGGQADEDNA